MGSHRLDLIYKIVDADLWAKAQAQRRFDGAGIDLADGYIHFSTAAQARETAARHFADQPNLLLVAVAAASLGPSLKWEPSRGGDLFPHLYGSLDLAHVVSVEPLPWEGRRHRFPSGFPA